MILTAGAVGLLAGLGLSLFQPRLYAAVTVISLEPEIFGQDSVNAMQALVSNYALQVRSPRLVEQALAAAQRPESAEEVRRATTVTGNPSELTITIRVVARQPEDAIALVRALVDQFQRELDAENRRRLRANRLRLLILEQVHSATQVSPQYQRLALTGAIAGLLSGLVTAGARSYRRKTTFDRPLEVEQFLGAPTLGAIPPGK